MKPYVPQFVQDAILDGTGNVVGWSQPALTEASAKELAALFPQWVVGTKMAPPEPVGTVFHLQAQVPWLVYSNGTSEDAYDVAILFDPSHGFGSYAYIYAAYEIQGTMAAGTPAQ